MGRYLAGADVTPPRGAPMIGLGLLEAIAKADILPTRINDR